MDAGVIVRVSKKERASYWWWNSNSDAEDDHLLVQVLPGGMRMDSGRKNAVAAGDRGRGWP